MFPVFPTLHLRRERLWSGLGGLLLGLLMPALPAAGNVTDSDTPADAGETPAAATFYATATVRERPLTSATAAVTVIERQGIEATGARTVAELLRFVPGLDVESGGTRGSLTTARIRGGDPNYTQVLLDGVPLNDGTQQIGDVFDLAGLTVAAVERLEVIRGPLSSVFGSTGLAGAINIITRRGGSGGSGGEVELEAGNASLLRAAASVSGAAGEASYFVALSWEEEAERVAAESFERGSVHANLDLALGARSVLRLSSRFADWRTDDYADVSGGPVYGSGELRRSDHGQGSLGVELRLGRERRHKLAAVFYRHRLDRESPAVWPLVPPSIESTDFVRSRLGWSGTLYASDRLQLAAGADVGREEGENRSTLLLPSFLGGEVSGDYRLARTTPGAYAELLVERGNLLLEVGSRLDFPEAVAAEGGGRQVEWSPRLGLRYRLGKRQATRLRASAGRSFKLPSFFALASPPQLGGNPRLRPETMAGADLGVEHDAEGAAAGLTLFYHRYEDLIDFDFEAFLNVNRSRVEARGVESYLVWRPDPRFTARFNITWQQVEDLGSGARLLHRPRWVGGLRLTWKPRPTLRLELSGQGTSSSFDQQLPVPELDDTAGYGLLAAAGSWRFAGGWELRGRVDNLADRDYETLIGFPGPGRSLRLGLRRTFGPSPGPARKGS